MLTLKSSPKIIAKNENVIPIIIDEINPTIKWGNSGLLSFKSLENGT